MEAREGTGGQNQQKKQRIEDLVRDASLLLGHHYATGSGGAALEGLRWPAEQYLEHPDWPALLSAPGGLREALQQLQDGGFAEQVSVRCRSIGTSLGQVPCTHTTLSGLRLCSCTTKSSLPAAAKTAGRKVAARAGR